jgi:hypothetical protein
VRSEDVDVRASERFIEDGVVTLQDYRVLVLVLRIPLRLRQAVKTNPDIPIRVAELVPDRRTTGPTLPPQLRQICLPVFRRPPYSSSPM